MTDPPTGPRRPAHEVPRRTRALMRRALPLALADTGDGLAFGALAATAGMGLLAPTIMSATAFSGSAQFSAVAIMNQHGGLPAILGVIFTLNARYLVMGATLAPALTGSIGARLGRALVITDGSWALAHQGEGRYDPRMLTVAGLMSLTGWTTGTVLGAALGTGTVDPARIGLDAIYPVYFLGLLLSYVTNARAWGAALIGAAVALTVTPFAPGGMGVLAAGAVGLVIGAARRG